MLRSRYFLVGALLLVCGTGPLLVVILLSGLGLTRDRTRIRSALESWRSSLSGRA